MHVSWGDEVIILAVVCHSNEEFRVHFTNNSNEQEMQHKWLAIAGGKRKSPPSVLWCLNCFCYVLQNMQTKLIKLYSKLNWKDHRLLKWNGSQIQLQLNRCNENALIQSNKELSWDNCALLWSSMEILSEYAFTNMESLRRRQNNKHELNHINTYDILWHFYRGHSSLKPLFAFR